MLYRPRAVMTRLIPSLTVAIAGLTLPASAGNVDLPRYPSISPDGQTIAFSWRGDLWTAPSAGGRAIRLTSHPADDLHSVWSPDGSTIAFSSTRTGHLNVFAMNADGSAIRHLTDIDVACVPTGFGVDADGGLSVAFHAALEGDVHRDFRPYTVALRGGDLERIHDAFGSQTSFSPDRSQIAFVRGGYYDRGFSERNYRGAEAADIWRFDRGRNTFHQLTTWEGNDHMPRWTGNGELVFLSDRELEAVNVFRMDATQGEATAVRLTEFSGRDVHHLDVSANGAKAVLAVWDTLYTLDLRNPNPRAVPIEIECAEDELDRFVLKKIGREVTEAALSPDGKVLAVVAYGEVYVRNVKEDSPTRRVTHGTVREHGLAWSPDGVRLYFTSDRDGTESIYAAAVERTRGDVKKAFTDATGIAFPIALDAEEDDKKKDAKKGNGDDAADDDPDAEDEDEPLPPELDPERWQDAITFTVTPVIQRPVNDRDARPSPDGRRLAFRSTRGDVFVHDLDSGNTTPLLTSWDSWTDVRWSPDGRHIAYGQSDLDFNRDIFIVPVDGSAPPVNISRHPNDDDEPRFSADGRILTFVSQRVGDEYDVWMVALDKALEALTPVERSAYYEQAAKSAKDRKPISPRRDDDDTEDADAPAPLDLDDAYLRLERVTRLEGDELNHVLTPAGDRIIFSAAGDEPGVYSIKWDGTDRKRLSGPADIQHVDLAGETLLVVADDQAKTIPLEGGDTETIGVRDEIRIDLAEQSSQKFLEAARGLGEGYYDPALGGVHWPTATRDYHELARLRMRTNNEFEWIVNRFVGELNGSHLRVRGPAADDPQRQSYGRIGIDHRRVAGGFEVTAVVPQGPADQEPMSLETGDIITAVDFEPIGPTDTIERSLKGRVGEETAFSVNRGGTEYTVLMTPISFGAERTLKYRAWRRRNAEQVADWSGGRIGYIHIQGMNQPSLDVFERDLFAAADGKDGLIIDVRNNGGGWTTDRVLSSIMVQPHAYTVPRGADTTVTGHYPQPRLFIQRYTLPMNLLCNEKSYSNAEIMSHAFKTLQRGTLVGQQTHGSVISTGGWSLVDGTWVRLPFRGWYLPDGTDMELHGAMPDLVVTQTPEAEIAGNDDQLRAAVDDLTRRLN